jgi:DNA primase large subunit
MKHLHKKLNQFHHLKHQGRLQYGLFLKGVGLTLEGALQFWRDEFTKKMTDSDFDKNYLYNFRHQFGQEGKKTNYSPYGCTKIILGTIPVEGNFHGCPYKHLDENSLRNELKSSSSLGEKDVEEIMDLTSQNHYQVFFFFNLIFSLLVESILKLLILICLIKLKLQQ